MLDLTTAEQAASVLVDRGWVFIDKPPNCKPHEVLDQAPAFFERRKRDWQRWQAKRPGEDEFDVGVLLSSDQDKNHSGIAKDNKAHLMYTWDMQRLMQKQCGTDVHADLADDSFLQAVSVLHLAGETISRKILSGVSTVLDLDKDLGAAYQFCRSEPRPTATSSTRIMQYFKEGGRTHLDRCAVTVHWGDQNGELFVVDRTGRTHVVSLPDDKVLVFASYKLEVATREQIKAVEHGSNCSAQDRRLAAVSFGQLITDPWVSDVDIAKEFGTNLHRIVTE